MLMIKFFIFLWILTGAVLCLITLFTEKGKEAITSINIIVGVLGMIYAIVVSPYWLISKVIRNRERRS